MRKIALVPYTVRVRPPNSKEYENLSSFGEDDKDALVAIRDILKELKAKNDAVEKHVLEITKVRWAITERRIEGIAESGEYGTETVIRDVNSWEVAHRKEVHHAEMLPFYFLFDLPETRDQGLLLLQRIGTFGIHGPFTDVLKVAFRALYPDYRLIINPLIPEDLLAQYLGTGGEVTQITFIKHSLSSDIANALGRRGGQKDGTMELAVKIREGGAAGIMARIRAYLSGKRKLQNLIELADETRFAYDTVKLKVAVDGQPRIVNLGDPKRLRADVNVSDQLKYEGGLPTFASTSQVAKELASEFLRNMYGTG
jgi:hypothetical protein